TGARALRMALLDDREQVGVLVLPLGRESPLFPKAFGKLGSEEGRLQAPVNNVPGQERVRRSIPEDVGIGVDARLSDRGAPVLAVALSSDDDRGHAPIAERQQRLVIRVTF